MGTIYERIEYEHQQRLARDRILDLIERVTERKGCGYESVREDLEQILQAHFPAPPIDTPSESRSSSHRWFSVHGWSGLKKCLDCGSLKAGSDERPRFMIVSSKDWRDPPAPDVEPLCLRPVGPAEQTWVWGRDAPSYVPYLAELSMCQEQILAKLNQLIEDDAPPPDEPIPFSVSLDSLARIDAYETATGKPWWTAGNVGKER